MENLFNSELIKQAAQSPLGILCPVAIILAFIALVFFS